MILVCWRLPFRAFASERDKIIQFGGFYSKKLISVFLNSIFNPIFETPCIKIYQNATHLLFIIWCWKWTLRNFSLNYLKNSVHQYIILCYPTLVRFEYFHFLLILIIFFIISESLQICSIFMVKTEIRNICLEELIFLLNKKDISQIVSVKRACFNGISSNDETFNFIEWKIPFINPGSNTFSHDSTFGII